MIPGAVASTLAFNKKHKEMARERAFAASHSPARTRSFSSVGQTESRSSSLDTFNNRPSIEIASLDLLSSSGSGQQTPVQRASVEALVAAHPDMEIRIGLDPASFYGIQHAHAMTAEQVVAATETQLSAGLELEKHVKKRWQLFGLNELKAEGGVRWWRILLHHIFDFMTIVLFGAMILALSAQDWVDAVVLALVIVVNVTIGFLQEFRSEKAMEALKSLSGSRSNVIRDGIQTNIDADGLVVGDIVLLAAGATVPADIRLCEQGSTGFECDEAVLTGESVPVVKDPRVVLAEDTAIADRRNIAFRGTTVVKGAATGVVIAIGMQTQIGAIAKTLAKAKKSAPKLQRNLKIMGLILVVCALASIGLVLLAGHLYGTFSVFPEGLLIGVAVAIALVPEGLMPILTLTMTFGVREMVKKNALVRKLTALEGLGHVTDICSDKTGTLTEGKMNATNLWIAGESYSVHGSGLRPDEGHLMEEAGGAVIDSTSLFTSLRLAVSVCSLCNMASVNKAAPQNAQTEATEEEKKKKSRSVKNLLKRRKRRGAKAVEIKDDGWSFVGTPTEIALQVLAYRVKMNRSILKHEYAGLVHDYPFDSNTKLMTVVYSVKQNEALFHVFVKGAPERLLPLCSTHVSDQDGTQETNSEKFEQRVRRNNEALASKGLRVLALAYRQVTAAELGISDVEINTEVPHEPSRQDFEQGLVFVGLVGIHDPPRPAVTDAVAVCNKAGITVHMCTGDQVSTAVAIASQIGIIGDDRKEYDVMEASRFDALTDEQVAALPHLPLVLARCTPETKVKMIRALHKRKRYVAMTGDGVNDAPAIKSADVGIAMGIAGSDVTKQSADIVLLDDSFGSIVQAIKEGRRIFTAIRRFLVHFLTSNVAEVILLLISILSGLRIPLNSTQILWINMVTGTPCALALGRERVGHGIMDKKHRRPDEPMFSFELIFDILFFGVLMGGMALGNFLLSELYFLNDHKESQGIAFAVLTVLLLLHAYVCRDMRRPFFVDGFYNAYLLHATVLLGAATTTATLYIPFINDQVMKHIPLSGMSWLIVLATAEVYLVCCEVYKSVKRVSAIVFARLRFFLRRKRT